ncbi:unnamed protein product [Trypanosoma congolense IL3000]|uniref:WGS project CAEQ00000000 data, annotated contig 730 n=1 Tax=Trypanosoma congolense (strain IL3000) TaxID=1068625 RepID=F9WI43_TRYCI|nr:unnamed protein product [Trypanosoma congolense IL3000]
MFATRIPQSRTIDFQNKTASKERENNNNIKTQRRITIARELSKSKCKNRKRRWCPRRGLHTSVHKHKEPQECHPHKQTWHCELCFSACIAKGLGGGIPTRSFIAGASAGPVAFTHKNCSWHVSPLFASPGWRCDSQTWEDAAPPHNSVATTTTVWLQLGQKLSRKLSDHTWVPELKSPFTRGRNSSFSNGKFPFLKKKGKKKHPALRFCMHTDF